MTIATIYTPPIVKVENIYELLKSRNESECGKKNGPIDWSPDCSNWELTPIYEINSNQNSRHKWIKIFTDSSLSLTAMVVGDAATAHQMIS